MATKPIIFQTPEVAKLLKASRFTLNRIMLRCGIETSVGTRGGRGSRLLFTMDDVATLALAYWLFRSGLRMRAIRQALDASNVKRFWKHLNSVERFQEVGTNLEFLVTWRSAKGRDALQEVRLENDFAGVQQILGSISEYGFIVIPIGRLLKELAEAIQKY
jgi:hypothetical protein